MEDSVIPTQSDATKDACLPESVPPKGRPTKTGCLKTLERIVVQLEALREDMGKDQKEKEVESFDVKIRAMEFRLRNVIDDLSKI